MSTEEKAEKAKKVEELAIGMYDCEYLKGVKTGEPCVYHSSTAQTLVAKGHIKVIKKIKKYVPKTMKE